MRRKAELEQEVLLPLCAGGCKIRIELSEEFNRIDGLSAQSVYVVRNVVQNYLDTKFNKHRYHGPTDIQLHSRHMTFPVLLPSHSITLEITTEVRLSQAGRSKVHKYLHAALLRANAALLLMLAEQTEHERLLSDGELESLFTFIDEASIEERDLIVALPHAV